MASSSCAETEDADTNKQWPVKDDLGYYQSCQEGGRWMNWWSKDSRHGMYAAVTRLWRAKDESDIPSQKELDTTLPVAQPYWLKGESGPSQQDSHASGIRATWLGHASVLAEVDSTMVLTDPMFSERASAVQWLGPKRYRPPACTVAQLPDKIDAVVISHNHYDHLDYNSVKSIQAKYGETIHWFVPKGVGCWLKHNVGCKEDQVHELVWWEEAVLPGSETKFVLTPANHSCQRGVMDVDKALWGSWAVIGPKHRFWFGGDTAYSDVFKQIGKRYGPFNLSAIPIGAYNPQWFMKWIHVNPEEALLIHQDLNSVKSFGIHWGTFKLTMEHYLEPKKRLLANVADMGFAQDDFEVVNIGSTVEGK